MPVSAAERRFILDQIVNLAQADINKMWLAAERQSDMEFAAFVAEAFPQIADPYHQLAAQTSATIFEADFPDLKVPAKVAEPLPAVQLAKSSQWALAADGVKAIDRMLGTIQRAIYDGDRDTTTLNVEQHHGWRYIRVARADACPFCKMLASRTSANATYRSAESATKVVGRSVNLSNADRRAIASGQMTREQALALRTAAEQVYVRNGKYGSKGDVHVKRLRGNPEGPFVRKHGDDYHDHCHCTAKAVPAGMDAMEYLYATEPEFAMDVEQFTREYEKARANSGSGDYKKILAAWK